MEVVGSDLSAAFKIFDLHLEEVHLGTNVDRLIPFLRQCLS